MSSWKTKMSMPRSRREPAISSATSSTAGSGSARRERLLVPGGDAAEGAARVAAAAGDHRGDAVAQAGGGGAAAIRPGQRREIGQLRQRVPDHPAVPAAAGDAPKAHRGRAFDHGASEVHERLLRLVEADGVQLGEIAEEIPGGEGPEVASRRDVAAVAALAQRHGQGQEVLRAPLEGQRERHQGGRSGTHGDPSCDSRELAPVLNGTISLGNPAAASEDARCLRLRFSSTSGPTSATQGSVAASSPCGTGMDLMRPAYQGRDAHAPGAPPVIHRGFLVLLVT